MPEVASESGLSNFTVKKSDVIQELEDNFTQAAIRLLFMPYKVIYNVISMIVWFPYKAVCDFSDAFISKSLGQLNLTKSEASDIAKKEAKKRLSQLRSLCIFMLLVVTIFSLSVGFSTTVYAGLYWVMIPADIIQE